MAQGKGENCQVLNRGACEVHCTKTDPWYEVIKAIWYGPCRVSAISNGGLLALSYTINKQLLSMIVYTLSFQSGVVESRWNEEFLGE